MNNVYPSRVDRWLAFVLVGAPAAVAAAGAAVFGRMPAEGILLVAFGLLLGGLIAFFAWPCRYEFTANELVVKCGIMEERIPYSRIAAANECVSWIAAPAFSTTRVRLSLGQESLFISPARRDQFVSELQLRMSTAPRN